MVLSEVEETIYVVDTDEATAESVVRVSKPYTCPMILHWLGLLTYAWTAALQTVKRNCDMLFVRGDGVVLVRVVSLLASLSSSD
jgi:U6 snRNA-associated Sm-like protein LSm3